MKALLRQNPTLRPAAPSAAIARARAMCAAVAAHMSDRDVAYAVETLSSQFLSLAYSAAIDAVESAARRPISRVNLAPTGSKRQWAFDSGGRIANAIRHEAKLRWNKAGERIPGGGGPMTARQGALFPRMYEVQRSVSALLSRLDRDGIAFDAIDERPEARMDIVNVVAATLDEHPSLVGELLDALSHVDDEFVIDRRLGQGERLIRKVGPSAPEWFQKQWRFPKSNDPKFYHPYDRCSLANDIVRARKEARQ